jgi:hypothetical protein
VQLATHTPFCIILHRPIKSPFNGKQNFHKQHLYSCSGINLHKHTKKNINTRQQSIYNTKNDYHCTHIFLARLQGNEDRTSCNRKDKIRESSHSTWLYTQIIIYITNIMHNITSIYSWNQIQLSPNIEIVVERITQQPPTNLQQIQTKSKPIIL